MKNPVLVPNTLVWVTYDSGQRFVDARDERDIALWHECGITEPALIRGWIHRGYHFWGHVLDRPEYDYLYSLYLDSGHDPSQKKLPHRVGVTDLRDHKAIGGIAPIPYCLRRDHPSAVLNVNNVSELQEQPKFDGHYMAASMAQFIAENFPFERRGVSRTFQIQAYRDDTSHALQEPYHQFGLSFNSFGAATVRFLEPSSEEYALNKFQLPMLTKEAVNSFNTHALTKLPNNFEGFELSEPLKPKK